MENKFDNTVYLSTLYFLTSNTLMLFIERDGLNMALIVLILTFT